MSLTTAPDGLSGEQHAWRKSFIKDGFIGPIRLYEPDRARELLKEIRIANQDTSNALYDNDVNYDRHFDIAPLSEHIGHPTIVAAVQAILGQDLFCWRTEFFPKFPGSAGTEWHQVTNYAYATGSPMLEPVTGYDEDFLDITVWTVFTDTDRTTGCMKFLPGSHHHAYYDESKSTVTGRTGAYRSVQGAGFFGYEFEDFKIDPTWFPSEEDAVAVDMRAGECVVFSARCVHGSHPNVTKNQTRLAIAARYTTPSVRVYPGWDGFSAHGGTFDLRDYGCVLVAGTDTIRQNRLRTYNNLGMRFPHARSAPARYLP